jgi:hypothetical protein
MKRRTFVRGVSAAIGAGWLTAAQSASGASTEGVAAVDVEKYKEAAIKRWEASIAKLEEQDKQAQHPADSILFVGSSSIRRWTTIGEDIAPYHPIQRGYGGSRWSDVAVFAERLIWPHAFRAAVFFVGNDISGGENDRTPAEVAGLFSYVLAKLRKHDENAPVFYVAVTPTQRRWKAWTQIKAGNTAARAVCENEPYTYFIGTESVFLDANRRPKQELFVSDQLHLNADGYQRWAAVIKSHLDTVLNGSLS